MLPLVKLALSGAHGVGKSTLARRFADELQLAVLPTPGRWMAKQGLPINQEASVASQTLAWLLQQQFEGDHTSWVASRSLVDIWAYTALAAERDTSPLAQSTFATLTTVTQRILVGRYTALLYLPPRVPLRPDEIRPADVHFQARIDELIRGALDRWQLPHLEIDATLPDVYERALRYVKDAHANVTAGADAT